MKRHLAIPKSVMLALLFLLILVPLLVFSACSEKTAIQET
jgi:hypothetical protein